MKSRGIAEKPKNFKETMIKLLVSLKEYHGLMILSIVFSFMGAILTIVGPNQLTKITDKIQEGIMTTIDTDYILKIGILLLILYLLSFIFSFLQSFVMSTVTQRYCKSLRTNLADKINRLPLKYFDSNSVGDILSKVSNDVDLIGHSLNQSISNLLSAVVLLISVVWMMFSTNVIMTITAISAALFGFMFMGLILSRSQKYFNLQQKELGIINGFIEENYSSLNVIKLYNGTDKAHNDFNSHNERLYKSAKMSEFMSGLMMPLMTFVGNFGYVAVTVMGAYLVLEGKITFGVIVAYMVYIRLFTNPLFNIAQSASSLQRVCASAERVYSFLEEDEVLKDKNDCKFLNPSKTKGEVIFDNISFGYNEELVIKGFSTKVKPGEKVAIVGPTGAGKTTLVNLLMRFYELNDGKIFIDGIDITDLKRDNIHNLFCMVLQDTWLFEDTIYENIRYNQKGITNKMIEDVCDKVGIDHLIRSLPNSYNTILSDADSLSAGEKQLLTIARAMLKKSPFLILDEATSNVDTRTEELVQIAMDKLMENKTSFIIAHRLSTIKNADNILVLKDGNILEQGNHKKLIKDNGFYADLYNSQFEK